MPKHAETQCWVTKTVWQRIPGRLARNSRTSTTETVQAITRDDQLPLTAGPQMLTTSNVGGWCAAVHETRRERHISTARARIVLGPPLPPPLATPLNHYHFYVTNLLIHDCQSTTF